MMGCRSVLLLFLATSVTQAFFVQILRGWEKKWRQAGDVCEDNGMTLPVLHTLTHFDDFVDFKDALALSEGVSADDFHPWLGLTHDGSNTTDPDNFVWTDGQTLTYLTAFHGDLDDDVINANASVNASEIVCVRLFMDRMKIGNCNWRRDTICQGSLDSTTANIPHFYIAANRVNGSSSASAQFVQATSDSQLPGSLGMRSLATPPTDVIDCFQLCATMTSCSVVAVLSDKTSCYVQVDQTSAFENIAIQSQG